jgi:hypothetical protein
MPTKKKEGKCWLCKNHYEIFDSGLCFGCWSWADDEVLNGRLRHEATEEEVKAHREISVYGKTRKFR